MSLEEARPAPRPSVRASPCRHCAWTLTETEIAMRTIPLFHWAALGLMTFLVPTVNIRSCHCLSKVLIRSLLWPKPMSTWPSTLTLGWTWNSYIWMWSVLKLRSQTEPYSRCEVCLRYFTKSLRATVFMQTVYSTVVQGNSDWVCDKGVNLTNIRKSVTYGCVTVTCYCDNKRDLTWRVLSSRLSRTSLDLDLDFGWTSCYCYR